MKGDNLLESHLANLRSCVGGQKWYWMPKVHLIRLLQIASEFCVIRLYVLMRFIRKNLSLYVWDLRIAFIRKNKIGKSNHGYDHCSHLEQSKLNNVINMFFHSALL